MFCNNCGKQIPDNARFCANCGNKVAVPAAPVPVTPVAEPAPVPVDPEPVVAPVYHSAPAEPAYQEPAPVYEMPAEPKKKSKKGLIILIIALVVVLAAAAVGLWLFLDAKAEKEAREKLENDYEAAMELVEEGKYDEALEALKELGDYEDSQEQVERLEQLQKDYDAAVKLLKDKDYEGALEAFEALEDYADSKEQAEELESLQEQYDLAMDHMENEEYTAALDILNELGDYRDSEELATYELPYKLAWISYMEAYTVDGYLTAISQFEDLGDYDNSQEMVSTCYLYICEICLNEGNVDTAMEYAEFLNDEDAVRFQELLDNMSADAQVLEALENALRARLDLSETTDDWSLLVEAEWEYLEDFLDAEYDDAQLEELMDIYLEGLTYQEEYLEGNSYAYYMYGWYYGAYCRSYAIEKLHDEYGFLADSDLAEAYVGLSDLFYACFEIEYELEDQLWGISPSEDSDGYYLTFTNNTDYSYDIYLLQRYGEGSSFVGPEYEHTFSIDSYETIRIPLEFPEDVYFDQWFIDWSFYNIYDGYDYLD